MNGGSKQGLNDTKSSQSEKEKNYKRVGEGFYKMGGEVNGKDKEKGDLVPVLNMQQGVNGHKQSNATDRSNFGIVLPNSSSTPRRLISPRG